jgi:isocitrate dehydrogenase
LRRTGVVLKAPITTPLGGGYKSLNVTIRKTLGLYANVRPCISYQPFVTCKHKPFDMVIVRENEEDLYAGIEHRQTEGVYQCLKLISRPGCEKIVRWAFNYAEKHGRKKVTGVHKSNIMKLTDGLFVNVFNEIGEKEFPHIKRDTMIVDIATAMVADQPERFDVVVLPNLYGDILSDVAAQVSGSVGLGSSVNIGDRIAMFEAIHGSAPDIAGKDIANPSGLLLAAADMLQHIDQQAQADTVFNAWMKTVEDGLHTADIYGSTASKKKVGTAEFTRELIARLGDKPKERARITPKANNMQAASTATKAAPAAPAGKPLSANMPESAKRQEKITSGVDIFLDCGDLTSDEIAAKLKAATATIAAKNPSNLELRLITNRGVKVWPSGFPETFCTDHWRCRFLPKANNYAQKAVHATPYVSIVELTKAITEAGMDIAKTENLCFFKNKSDGKIESGFSMGQGE